MSNRSGWPAMRLVFTLYMAFLAVLFVAAFFERALA